jgi:hypothetical protein
LFLFFTFTLDNQDKINEKNAEFEVFGNTEDLPMAIQEAGCAS